jgi:hypothetical protein
MAIVDPESAYSYRHELKTGKLWIQGNNFEERRQGTCLWRTKGHTKVTHPHTTSNFTTSQGFLLHNCGIRRFLFEKVSYITTVQFGCRLNREQYLIFVR